MANTLAGERIGSYDVLEEIGRGGMGVVYKAMDTRLKRVVALKFLPHEALGTEAEKKRFMREARAAAALDHPNIGTIYEIDEIDGRMFISMAYIEGPTVKEIIEEGPMEVETVFNIAAQLAKGLHAAHELGIIHRDIKSANIIVTPNGRVKITDFGVAKLSSKSRTTNSGTRVGTLAYNSPEQIRGGKVDQRSDLWSYGVMLYEMLTGELPFRGEYDASLLYEILNVEPIPVQSYRSDVGEHLQVLISRLLQKEANRRFSSMAEVIQILKGKSPRSDCPRAPSVAVLYFDNMSSDGDNEHICSGLTEDIITDLTAIEGVNVIPRIDVLPYRGKEVDCRQLGKKLGLDYLLQGSVRKSGDRLRITTQLIDVKTGFQVWAERFDRTVEDPFEVQEEVSRKVTEALKESLIDCGEEIPAQRLAEEFLENV